MEDWVTPVLQAAKMTVLSDATGGLKNRPYYFLTIPSSLPLSRLRERRNYEKWACAHRGIKFDKNISFDGYVVTPASFISPSLQRRAHRRSYIIFYTFVYIFSCHNCVLPQFPISSRMLEIFIFKTHLIIIRFTKWHLSS